MILKQGINAKYSKFILTGTFSIFLITGYAQQKKEEQEIKTQSIEQTTDSLPRVMDSIVIVREYRPILADAVKIRRSPDMKIDRNALEIQVRQIAADMYFGRSQYKQPYSSPLLQRYPDAKRSNIDNHRIGILAYLAGENERATSILQKVEPADAFYQSSLIALGNIALKTGDKQRARNDFYRASKMNLDQEVKSDALFNYAKSLYELDSLNASLVPLQEFISMKYTKEDLEATNSQSTETLLSKVLLGSSNFQAAVYLLESFKNREQKSDSIYQKITYYRGMEFYNERAFENSISMFMRSEKYPLDPKIAALATYWKAEAMYEVRKYGEAVDNFSRFLKLPAARNTEVFNYANYALAYAAFRINRYGVAAEYFERYLSTQGSELDKDTRYDVIARLGDSYLSLRDYTKANQYYDQLITNKAPNQDYALFQHGIIQGLQGDQQAKRKTLESVVQKFPGSNYADDVAFEIPYISFVTGDYDTAIQGLEQMIKQYPRSSYVPRALMTIGLVQYNKNDNEAAMGTFQRVIKDYPTTSEASQALLSIENIYLDQGDATGYIRYATSANITTLSESEQDNLAFQAGRTLFARKQYGPAVEAINAYFDKFPKPRQEKHARYIRGVSSYHTGHPQEALHDLNIILNDWTSPYTENTLITVAELYLGLKEYNEAIVHLKKLQLNSDYKDRYGYAITNLMVCYFELGDYAQMKKYVDLIKNYQDATNAEVATAHLYSAKAFMEEGDITSATKELNLSALKSTSAVSAEARYRVGLLQYQNKEYDKAQKSAFDVIENMDTHDYWVAKSFILLADTYARKGDALQARKTLESIIENYAEDDDVIPSAKERLQKLKKK